MKDLSIYIREALDDRDILIETLHEMNIMTINEAFNSKILTNLANSIKKFEEPARKNDAEQRKRAEEESKQRGYTVKPSVNAMSFASMFGPTDANVPVGKGRYSSSRREHIRGIKWNEITDDMFTKYDGYDAKLHKVFKSLCNKKKAFIAIACEPDTDNIVYVVRGFDDNSNQSFWELAEHKNKWNNDSGVVRKEKPKGNSQWYKRDYKGVEMLEDMNDYDVYLLEITDEMKSEYKSLYDERTEQKKGVVNYDDASLKQLAAENKVMYKKLAKELRAKRLQENPKALYDKIKEANQKVLALYDKIIADDKYIGSHYGIGDAMSYVNDAFRQYYDFLRNQQEYNDAKSHDDGSYAERFIKGRVNDSINDVKKRIDYILKEIDKLEKELAA